MVEKFLQQHNQSTNNIDVTQMVASAMQEMRHGLQNHGTTIPMIPTYLQNIGRDKIKLAKRLLIDAGGTNFRSAIGYFDENGNVQIEQLQKTKMPASDELLTKQQFYDKIASNVAYLLDDCTDVGFCFSYQVDMQPNMDGKVAVFSKEVKAPEVVGTFVGVFFDFFVDFFVGFFVGFFVASEPRATTFISSDFMDWPSFKYTITR